MGRQEDGAADHSGPTKTPPENTLSETLQRVQKFYASLQWSRRNNVATSCRGMQVICCRHHVLAQLLYGLTVTAASGMPSSFALRLASRGRSPRYIRINTENRTLSVKGSTVASLLLK